MSNIHATSPGLWDLLERHGTAPTGKRALDIENARRFMPASYPAHDDAETQQGGSDSVRTRVDFYIQCIADVIENKAGEELPSVKELSILTGLNKKQVSDALLVMAYTGVVSMRKGGKTKLRKRIV